MKRGTTTICNDRKPRNEEMRESGNSWKRSGENATNEIKTNEMDCWFVINTKGGAVANVGFASCFN